MSETNAARFNDQKPRMSLVPGSFATYCAAGLTYGAAKYNVDNWRRGFKWRSILDSFERHLQAFKDGEDFDEESGLPHLAHMACNLAFLIEHYDKGIGQDDRVKVGHILKELRFNEPPQTLKTQPKPY